jgi:hypothetical protein
LSVFRTNKSWTRLFLTPDAGPFSLAAGRHDLTLEFEASDGNLAAARSMGHRPSVIEREGL